jgi:two-component system, cell cycle sensor histidine kinase and response regulator CckA
MTSRVEKETERGGAMTILLLDNEQIVRDIAAAALTKAGFTVLETVNANAAISRAASCAEEIALFIINHRLPEGLTGREVAEKILELRPNMQVLHISGYPERRLRIEGDITPGGFYLAKPFLPRQLVDKAREILGPRHRLPV